MTESIDRDALRRTSARAHGLTDLGRLPERIRKIASFWGGSTTVGRALYELAQRDGLTRSISELRSEMAGVHDPRVRDELLAWLASRGKTP